MRERDASFPIMLFEIEAERLKTRHDYVSPSLSRLLEARSLALHPVFCSLIACKTSYHQTCAKNFSNLALLAM
jgi:hypothetical protein